jgi:hypothetical protein
LERFFRIYHATQAIASNDYYSELQRDEQTVSGDVNNRQKLLICGGIDQIIILRGQLYKYYYYYYVQNCSGCTALFDHDE